MLSSINLIAYLWCKDSDTDTKHDTNISHVSKLHNITRHICIFQYNIDENFKNYNIYSWNMFSLCQSCEKMLLKFDIHRHVLSMYRMVAYPYWHGHVLDIVTFPQMKSLCFIVAYTVKLCSYHNFLTGKLGLFKLEWLFLWSPTSCSLQQHKPWHWIQQCPC